ncbi:transglycosylase SLT domain-containing protein [Fervidobacterium islandicum]|uniref:Transglycosylase SLT domain-containing protein n=1 Tax=Fervidobacterium islandicum TaxID=2423 RepID=A0AAI8GE66_FERIS|nr:transglycosylase SLT domain-containing protein [Fervidobacterium islandicum]AMW33752.2 transglycosylase SLT domain-containing protein [Fervidobacterium islandicum]
MIKLNAFMLLLFVFVLASIVGFGQENQSSNQIQTPEWFKNAVVKKRAGINLKTAPEFINDLWSAIYTISTKYQVPPTLIAALISVESNFANVKGGGDVVGMMQISISTAKNISKLLGLEPPKNGWDELLTNHWMNITYGTAYISYLYKKTGSFQKALEMYNNGKNKTSYAQMILKQYEYYEGLHIAELKSKQQNASPNTSDYASLSNSATQTDLFEQILSNPAPSATETANASNTSTNSLTGSLSNSNGGSTDKLPPLFGVTDNKK